jgi:hypothetical protein
MRHGRAGTRADSRARARVRRAALAGLALAVLAGTAACGDDDEAANEPQGAESGGKGGLDGGLAISAAACDAYVGFSQALGGDPAALEPAATALTAAMPEGLASTVTTIQQAMTSEDPEAMASPEYAEASEQLGGAVFDGCEATQLDVTGVDYGFEGLPEEVPAGRVAIRFTNGTEMDEPHEFVLFKRNEGTTEPIEDLLALPQDQAMSKLTMAGMAFAMTPASASVTMTELEAGDYVAVCMLPTDGDGPPHAMGGMTAEFTVA